MTARRAFLSNFWVGTKGGLLTAKHIRKMGMARWLFDYLTRGQTSVNQHGVGVFNYGHPITLEQIAADMDEGEYRMPVRTIRRWMAALKRAGYISIECHGTRGVTVWIANAKDKTKRPRTHHASETLATESFAATSGLEEKSLAAKNGRESKSSRPQIVTDSPQATETANLAPPIPKGFIPKNPSYYNKDAAAKAAAVPVPSMKEILREKTPPRGKSQAELDARRRELLQQAERIKRDYPAKESSPGKVVEMQRQEATA